MSFSIKSYLLPLCIIGWSLSLSAQNKILKGVVRDAGTKEALIGAVVYDSSDMAHATTTDVNGNYQLNISPGKHVIICSIVSMEPDTFVLNADTATVISHNFHLRSGTTAMQTIVVSVGKYERKLEDITVSMDVIKPSLIENKNSSNIKDALEQVPGLNILDGEPQIRGGSGFDFGVGTRVAILIDGLPALAGDGGALEWNFIPLENVEQVEVVKGAASVEYGSSALSGSINIRTAYATDRPITKVSISAGMYDTPPIDSSKWWNGVASFSTVSFMHAQKMGQWDVVIGGMGKYDYGYIGPPKYDPNLPVDTTIKNNQVGEKTGRFNFSIRRRAKKLPGLNYGINGNFMKSTNNLTLVWENDSNNIYRAFPHTLTLQTQNMFYIDPFINYLSDNGLMQSLRTRYFYTNNTATNQDYSTNKETPNIITNTQVLYTEYQITKKINESLNLTGGLIMNQTMSHSGEPYKGVAPDNKYSDYAFFAQVDKKFFGRLNVSVGFRAETSKMDSESALSKSIFRAGLNYRLMQATFLRCSFGQGYRFPSIAEKYTYSDVGGIPIFPNPNLLPENSWNAEVGIKQGFKINKFVGSLDIAAFQQEYYNTIEITYGGWGTSYDASGNPSVLAGFKYLNTGETRIRGLEVSLPAEGKITKDLKIGIIGDYTFIIPQAITPDKVYATDSSQNQISYAKYSTDTTNNILKYRFQTIAKVDLQITYRTFSIGGDIRYYSHMQNLDEAFNLFNGIEQYRAKHTTGTTIYDARIGMQATKQIKVAFIVNNLMNLSYSLRPLKIEPPRTFAIRISYEVN
ncbi:MAG TPA: TonB-dependent receptor [Bacteroidia bacterium]|nr:TonB-dependent receptor [Bacteroidia bacterium]